MTTVGRADREADRRQAADLLRAGELVAFPTETVYGLGADATNGAAVAAILWMVVRMEELGGQQVEQALPEIGAGLDAVPRSQWEAVTALNMKPWTAYRDVILPQALRPVLPALGNYLISILKDTPVLSAITVVEIMQRAKNIGSESFRYLEPITMVGLFFLILSLGLAWCVRRLENRMELAR